MKEFLVQQAMLFLQRGRTFHLKMSIICYFCMKYAIVSWVSLYNSALHGEVVYEATVQFT